MYKSHPKSFNFEDGCETIDVLLSNKEEFEIVTPSDTIDYEVIPTQQIRQLDEKDLEIHENYFLFGSRNLTDSDSDIEIVSASKPPRGKANTTRELYSDVLQRNNDKLAAPQDESFDAWGIADLMNENKSDDLYDDVDWNSDNDDDSSGIEVVDSHPNDSLEIIFTDDVNLTESRTKQDTITEELARSFSSDDGDYGIHTLFESMEDDCSHEPNYISIRTFTLVFMFCVCVFGGISAGCGFGSLFVSDEQKSTSNIVIDDDEPPFSTHIVSDDHIKIDISQIWLSSNSKKEIQSVLRSFWLLQEENKRLQSALNDYKDRYHLQKQMNWYWRRQVKGNGRQKENRKIHSGFMSTETVHDVVESIIQDVVNFSSFKLENESETVLVTDLQNKLEREKGKTRYWKQKYSSVHQSRSSVENGSNKSENASEFTFSSCLKILSKVWPNFKITSGINNLTKPVEEMTEHVQSAWGRIKKRWQRNNDSITKQNAKRFRKMFSIGNIINSARTKTSSKHNEENNYCADEAFKQFQRRWREPSTINFPKPQNPLKKSDKIEERRTIRVMHNCPKDTFIEETEMGFIEELSILNRNDNELSRCKVLENMGDFFVEEIEGKFKTIEKNPDHLSQPTNQSDPNISSANQKSSISNREEENLEENLREDLSDGQLWYKKKLNDVEFSNDLKLWKLQGYFQNLISDLEDQLLTVKEDSQRIQRVFKESEYALLQRQKEQSKEVKNLKKVIRKKQESLDDWKFKEKLVMKREIEHLKDKIQDFKRRSKQDQLKSKKTMKTYVKSEHNKFQKNRRPKVDEKLVKKVSYYKTKYQILEEDMRNLKSKYEILQNLYKNKKDLKAKTTGPENDIQWSWELPTVYCPDQQNCAENGKDVSEKQDETEPHPTIFEMARIYDHGRSFTPVPPKPTPPKRLQYPRKPETRSSVKDKFLKPSPPLKWKENQNRSGYQYEEEEEEMGYVSWYDYWGKNRETYNVYSEAEVRRLNWYLLWMKHREEERNIEKFNTNWYFAMMKNRERQRDTPFTWYDKWMQGRRNSYDQ